MAENEDKIERGERLAKYMASVGVASRRSCEQLIVDGFVTVNGVPVTSPAFNVKPGEDEVCFNGKVLGKPNSERVYIMLNKPAGYTCSAKDSHAKELVYQLIPERFGRVFTIGRLDRDSEGLLLLTNDGDFAQRLMHPSQRVLKRYLVECEGQFTTSMRRALLDGMYDNGEFLHALDVEEKSIRRGHCLLIFTLGEGKKREVRRLCKDVGLKVLRLQRIAIGELKLDESLPLGGWRQLSADELVKATTSPELPKRATTADPSQAKPYWQMKPKHVTRAARIARDEYHQKQAEEREEKRPARPAKKRTDWDNTAPWKQERRNDRKAFRDAEGAEKPAAKRPWYEGGYGTSADESESREYDNAPRNPRNSGKKKPRQASHRDDFDGDFEQPRQKRSQAPGMERGGGGKYPRHWR